MPRADSIGRHCRASHFGRTAPRIRADIIFGKDSQKRTSRCLPQSKYAKAGSVPPEAPIQKRSIWYGPDLVLGVAATTPLAAKQWRKIGNCLHDRSRLEAEFLGNLCGAALNPERVQPGRRGAIDVPGIRRDEAKLGVGDLELFGGQIVDPWADLVCAGLSPRSADRIYQFTRGPWRTSSPLRPDLGFRYTQVQRSGVIVAIPILAGLHHQYVRI